MKHTDLSFDLPGFLLGEVYGGMDAGEMARWSQIEAANVARDLAQDGIAADAGEIYEIIAEFIAQDAEEESE